MHTALGLNTNMFSIVLCGKASNNQDLLGWDIRDRLGVIVTSPFGGLGAGLLTCLAITAFYDMPGRDRRARPMYPDIYMFHVGGPWGCHAGFDFWPDRKELFLAPDPTEVLRSINNCGITHLVVPDATPREVIHRHKEPDAARDRINTCIGYEPEAARDRIKKCFAYGPEGSVASQDVSITTSAESVLRNFENTLHPALVIASMEKRLSEDPQYQEGTSAGVDGWRGVSYMRRRVNEIPKTDSAYLNACRRVNSALSTNVMTETIRRIEVETALDLLA
jgi:hypothetical protein